MTTLNRTEKHENKEQVITPRSKNHKATQSKNCYKPTALEFGRNAQDCACALSVSAKRFKIDNSVRNHYWVPNLDVTHA